MKLNRFIALLLGLCLFAGCASKPREPQRLTILTYNVHHCEGIDKKLDIARIASVINAVYPDFVALQEVDNKTTRTGHVDQTAEIAELTKMHGYFGKAMAWEDGEYGDSILSRFAIDKRDTVALPWTKVGQHEPRGAPYIHCKLPGGEKITFISTHLDHTGVQTDRPAQVKALNEAFKDEKLAILAGDMNCTPKSDPMQVLYSQWTDTTGDDAAPTVPVGTPKAKIDYVLVKPAGRWKVIETRVLDEKVASDHRAFLAIVELAPESIAGK